MKKCKAVLFALAVVAPFAVGPAPAQAHSDACAGVWGLFINAGLYPTVGYPGNGSGSTGFTLANTGAACAASFSLEAYGTISGQCLAASGWGRTSSGHTFWFNWLGATLYVEGEVSGALNVAEMPYAHECFTGEYTRVNVVGALSLSH